jgi:hypothetical protein
MLVFWKAAYWQAWATKPECLVQIVAGTLYHAGDSPCDYSVGTVIRSRAVACTHA